MIPKWVPCLWFGCPLVGAWIWNLWGIHWLGIHLSHDEWAGRLYILSTLSLWYLLVCGLIWAWNDNES